MALATLRDSKFVTTQASQYGTNTVAIPAGELIVVYFHVSGTALDTPSASPNNEADLKFSRVAVVNFTTAGNQGRGALFIGQRMSSGANEGATVDFTGDAGTGCMSFIWSISGMTRVGGNAARQIAQENAHAAGTPAPTFALNALTNNPVLGFVGDEEAATNWVAPTGWTEPTSPAGEGTITLPTMGSEAVGRDSGFTGTTVTWGSASTGVFSSLIIELDISEWLVEYSAARARTSRSLVVGGPWILAHQETPEIAVVTGSVTINVDTPGQITWTGQSVGLVTSLGITAGAVTWNGQALGLKTSIGVAAGNVTWAGATDIVLQGIPTVINVDVAGAITWTGQTVGLKTSITPTAGAITWSGQALPLKVSVAVVPGAVTWNGSAITLVQTITPVSGAITWQGQALPFKTTVGITAGQITWTGSAVTLIATGGGTPGVPVRDPQANLIGVEGLTVLIDAEGKAVLTEQEGKADLL